MEEKEAKYRVKVAFRGGLVVLAVAVGGHYCCREEELESLVSLGDL